MESITRRDDSTECACVRCRGIDPVAPRRGMFEALGWSFSLVRSNPSILFVFLLPVVGRFVAGFGPVFVQMVAEFGSGLGVFFARGYVAVVGTAALLGNSPSPRAAGRTVCRRFPALIGAIAVAASVVLGVFFALLAIVTGLEAAGIVAPDPIVAIAAVVVYIVIVALVVKFCLVPEACVVGRYGPIEAIRASWEITSFHRWKAVAATAGLGVLVAIELLFGGAIGGGGDGLIVIELGYEETELNVFSFGPDTDAGWLGSLGNALATATYYGVFVHLYVTGTLES